jgi:WD40 repeat protein
MRGRLCFLAIVVVVLASGCIAQAPVPTATIALTGTPRTLPLPDSSPPPVPTASATPVVAVTPGVTPSLIPPVTAGFTESPTPDPAPHLQAILASNVAHLVPLAVVAQDMVVGDLAFGSSGILAAGGTQSNSGAVNRLVRLLDLDHGQTLRQFSLPYATPTDMAFSPDGNMIAVAGLIGTPLFWNLNTGEPFTIPDHLNGPNTSVDFSPAGDSIVYGYGVLGSVHLWNYHSGRLILQLRGDPRDVLTVAFSTDGAMFLAGGNGARLSAWNTATGQLLYALDESGPICNLAASSNHDLAVTLCTYTNHYTVEVRDLANGRLLNTFKEQAALGRDVFSPDGQLLLTRSPTDGTISIWATSSGQLLRALDGGNRRVVNGFIPPAEFSRDGQYLASASQSGIQLWGVPTP